MKRAFSSLLVLAGVAGIIAGCGTTTVAVTIRHPLHVGQVDPNQVPIRAGRHENIRGLPAGTLVDTAELTTVNAQQICANVTLWSTDDLPARGLAQSYRVALLTDQDGVEQTQVQVQPGQPTSMPVQGSVRRRIPNGWTTYCARRINRRCVRWRRRRRYTYIRVPRVWQVSQHPMQMCFPNGGFVTPQTQRVRLEFNGQGVSDFRFEWLFSSQVAATQGGQPQQTQQQQ